MATKLRLGGFDGRSYKSKAIANTDFRKFDGTLRLIIDMSAKQKESLAAFLDHEYHRGQLCYGLHSQKQALMTCFVRDYDRNHLHFVDGAGGGYAVAAKQFKR